MKRKIIFLVRLENIVFFFVFQRILRFKEKKKETTTMNRKTIAKREKGNDNKKVLMLQLHVAMRVEFHKQIIVTP